MRVAREKWDPKPPNVDFDARLLLQRRYARGTRQENRDEVPARADAAAEPDGHRDPLQLLRQAGKDYDFGKPKPLYPIAKPPFYAGWATPVIHDTRAGLRINAKCQVVDLNGEVIQGLYCGGESAGGFSMHGLARATCQGFIAGTNAVKENGKA